MEGTFLPLINYFKNSCWEEETQVQHEASGALLSSPLLEELQGTRNQNPTHHAGGTCGTRCSTP